MLQPYRPKSIMKRLFLVLFVAVIAFSSCENVETNSPAFQAEIDSIFFKANDVRGEMNEDGSFTIQGINQEEKLTLTLEKAQLGTYTLGGGSASSAIYTDPAGNEYTTAPNGQGQIELTDRCISCGLLTGNFNFMAINPGVDTLVVQKGVFFEVSFLDGSLDDTAPIVGTFFANVNGNPFEANVVEVDANNATIVVTGMIEERSIRIQVPANSVSGNYMLPRAGFSASYTVDGVTTPAEEGGLVSVNFNDTSTRKIRIFFNFTAGGDVITNGDTRVDY